MNEQDKLLISAYADGALSPDDAARAESLLAGDRACRAYLEDIRKISMSLSVVKDEQLSPDAEIQIIQRLHKETTYMKPNTWKTAATVCVIIIITSLALQTYIKRGIQGRLKSATDDIGDQYATASAANYQALIKDANVKLRDNGNLPYEAYYTKASAVAEKLQDKIERRTVATVRKVIRNARVSLNVKDAQQSQLSISAIILKFKGTVINSNIYKLATGSRNGNVVFKVLPKDLDNVLSDIKKLGGVESEVQTGEDVTENYVDLLARLQNYKLVKDRLLKILDEKAREVKDILDVEREMSRVGTEIESLEGKIKFIDQQTDMSTVAVSFYESSSRILGGINVGDKFKKTLHVSAETCVNTFNGIIILFAAIIPIGFWLLLGWGGWLIIRHFIKK